MSRPRENPTNLAGRSRNQPPSRKSNQNREDTDRTIPGQRHPAYEKQERNRGVNEDEQRKAVNNAEDNAQSRGSLPMNEDPSETFNPQSENENERLEAGDDQNEVNPRTPKVN